MKPDLAGNVPHCAFHLANVSVGHWCHCRARARWGARVSLARLKQELLDPGTAGGELPPVQHMVLTQVHRFAL